MSGMCIGGGVGLFKGGLFTLRNLLARVALRISGAAPLRYTPFLEFGVDRLFLQRVGGGYSFAHRLVMEYFAAMPESDRTIRDRESD
jgi:eukaryotic-like serine/threonine-protein kinase